MIDHDGKKKENRRSMNSFQKSNCPDGGSSSTKVESNEREASCNKAEKKKKKKSRRSNRRSTSNNNMVREDSLTTFISNTSECRSCHQSMDSTQAQVAEMQSSPNRSKRNAMSLTNRYEMTSILEGIRAQRDDIEMKGQFHKSAVKVTLEAYLEEQRRVILWKWRAMELERKSRAAAQLETMK
ncbi:hypothetical protein MHU86_21573 [Fragilaria crotonensis]|nr:hypothetical protein MHU86_21573 [Fragilaria crotonensis]